MSSIMSVPRPVWNLLSTAKDATFDRVHGSLLDNVAIVIIHAVLFAFGVLDISLMGYKQSKVTYKNEQLPKHGIFRRKIEAHVPIHLGMHNRGPTVSDINEISSKKCELAGFPRDYGIR